MDKHQKAIEELKKQIKLGRERLGPERLKELEKLARTLKKPKAAPAAKRSKSIADAEMIPYDKKSAAKALEIFLKNHSNPKEFQKRLLEMLKKVRPLNYRLFKQK